jgi:hypothetical protein
LSRLPSIDIKKKAKLFPQLMSAQLTYGVMGRGFFTRDVVHWMSNFEVGKHGSDVSSAVFRENGDW